MTRQSRNAALFVFVRCVSLLIPLLNLPLLGRALNPEGIGLLAYAQALALYGSVTVDFGLNSSAISTAARYRPYPGHLRTLLWTTTALRCLPFVVCVLVLVSYVGLSGVPGNEQQILLLSLFLLISVLITPTWLYQGLEYGGIFSMLSVLPRLLTFPLIFLFVHTTEHVARAALILFGAEFVAAVCLFVYASWRLAPGTPRVSRRALKVCATRTFDIWLGALITTSISSVTPVMVKALVGLHAVGLYSAADRLVRAFYSFLYPVVQAYQAEVTRRWSQPGGATSLVRRLMVVLAGGAMVFVLLSQWLATDLVSMVFGAQFAEAGRILQIMSFWPLVAVLTSIGIHYLYLARGVRKGLKSSYMVACVVHFTLLPQLIEQWGGVGAALSMAMTQTVLMVLILGRRRRVSPAMDAKIP